jgi:hypothetical protein
MATIKAIEKCLIDEWNELAESRSCDPQRVNNALSNLASTMAYLLNQFLEPDPTWREFGADDLLHIKYDFPSPLQMTASGLMCWGDGNRNYPSPFMGEFEREADTNQIKDFTLFFAATSPDRVLSTIPYTRDESDRQRLFESRPSSPEGWAHVFRRADLSAD